MSGVVSIGRGDRLHHPAEGSQRVAASRARAKWPATGSASSTTPAPTASGSTTSASPTRVLSDGQQFRIGDTFLECHAKVEEADAGAHDGDGRLRRS